MTIAGRARLATRRIQARHLSPGKPREARTFGADEGVPSLYAFGAAELARAVVVAVIVAITVLAAVPGALRRRQPLVATLADALVDAFERLGPTFVKLGQLIASSPGLFPATLSEACRRCLDRVPPEDVATVRAIVEADLGRPIGLLFGSFDDQPLSAASIAQVHACTLHDGRAAVVKVQRPNIGPKMNTDLRLLVRAARLLARSKRVALANPVGVIEDLHRVTNEELDFALEADRQVRFRGRLHAFGDNAVVTAPEVYSDHCGPRVICMERMNGRPVDKLAADTNGHGELLLRQAVKAWLEAACLHGPFHGDLHAGNLWALDDGRVAFLDFGITGELDHEWRQLLRALFAAIAGNGDYGPVAAAFKRVGVVPVDAGSDDEVGERLAMVIEPMLGHSSSTVSLGAILQLAITTFTQFGAHLPVEMVLVAKQLLYVERYTAHLAPEWVLARDQSLFVHVLDPATERNAAGVR